MTLALTGPWAWAELGDPPPGEPPGPPTPPPPPDPPPPPLPPDPDPGGPGPGYIPTFAWHADGALVSLWDVDLKVTPGADPAGENTPCRVLDSSGSLDRWPYDYVYNSAAEVYEHGVDADWSLNDPARTYDLLQLHNVSLYLHDANAGTAASWIEGADYRCDWISLAALNDHIEAVEGPAPETFTGIVLGRKRPNEVAVPGYTVADLGMCFYRSFVVRARAEAYVHPHHKVVLVDELSNMLASPFHLYDGSTAINEREDVQLLHQLAGEPNSLLPFSGREACDAVWADIDDELHPVAEGWHLAASADQAPVELWGKFNAATVPLHLVPSVMLGVPAFTVTPEKAADAFGGGDAMIARWGAAPLEFGAAAPERVRLRYLLTPYSPAAERLELRAEVNGIPLPAATLETSSATSGDLSRLVHTENIYAVDVVVWETGTSISLWPWSQDPAVENTVEVQVVAVGSAATYLDPERTVLASSPVSAAAAYTSDRAFLVWAIEVVYEDAAGAVIDVQSFEPEDAIFSYAPASGAERPCTAEELCQTNADLLLGGRVDGVLITQDTLAEWPFDDTFAQVAAPLAWSRFVGHATKYLNTLPSGPVRTLVDERSWVSDTSEYLSTLNFANTLMRLGVGYTDANGVNVLWLPLDFEDMNEDELATDLPQGRFAERPPLDDDWPYLAYLPRLTRNRIDESILWTVDTGGDPACDGTWTVRWRAPDCPVKWTYGPVVDVGRTSGSPWVSAIAPLHQYTFAQLIEIEHGAPCADLNVDSTGSDPYVPGPHEGAFGFELEPANAGLLRFGWEVKDDLDSDTLPDVLSDQRIDVGNTGFTPAQVEFRLDPPTGCAGYSVEQQAHPSGALFDFYTQLTCVLQNPEAGACL
jgi:hypothetical protein